MEVGVKVPEGSEVGVMVGIGVGEVAMVEGKAIDVVAVDGADFIFGMKILEGVAIIAFSARLADCNLGCGELLENKNKLPVVASPQIIMIKSF